MVSEPANYKLRRAQARQTFQTSIAALCQWPSRLLSLSRLKMLATISGICLAQTLTDGMLFLLTLTLKLLNKNKLNDMSEPLKISDGIHTDISIQDYHNN